MLVTKATVSGDVFHAEQDVIAHCKADPFFNFWWKWGSNLHVLMLVCIYRIFCLWRVGHRWFLLKLIAGEFSGVLLTLRARYKGKNTCAEKFFLR